MILMTRACIRSILFACVSDINDELMTFANRPLIEVKRPLSRRIFFPTWSNGNNTMAMSYFHYKIYVGVKANDTFHWNSDLDGNLIRFLSCYCNSNLNYSEWNAERNCWYTENSCSKSTRYPFRIHLLPPPYISNGINYSQWYATKRHEIYSILDIFNPKWLHADKNHWQIIRSVHGSI